MSTANRVPETYELTGDDAWDVLSRTGRGRLMKDAFQRLRWSDGFSHARSLAFATTLVIMQSLIAIVGLASALGEGKISQLIVRSLQTAVPGPAGKVLTQAVNQAHQASSSHQYTALIVGLVGSLITGATAMGQLERGLNRLYGIEQDRPTLQKYGRAFVLALTAGVLASAAFASLALGRAIASGLGSDLAITLWNVLRWPAALLLTAGAVALLFRWSPRRRQPGWSWLAFGAMVSMVFWALSTLALALFFQISSTFGQTYGPLAGIVALMVWALLSAISLLYGASVAAQLEAVRSGDPAVQDPRKAALPTSVPAAG